MGKSAVWGKFKLLINNFLPVLRRLISAIVLAAFKEFELVALRHQGFSRDTRVSSSKFSQISAVCSIIIITTSFPVIIIDGKNLNQVLRTFLWMIPPYYSMLLIY